ncbi:hypothetical protein MMC10_001239 [Thelotrema lepadinum]|nr:hypothetical protein [Thelotrema lepadinum]
MAPTSGLLYVTMHPHPTLSAHDFHDWYNNEHGPTRLRLPYITSGFRYYATDLSPSEHCAGTDSKPEWLAWYDITDMNELTKDSYMRLRVPPAKSERETYTMSRITVNRKLFDFVAEWKSPSYHPLEDPTTPADKGNVLVSVTFTLKSGVDKVSELDKWYEEEHVRLLSAVPGWLRTRRYTTSTITPAAERKETEYVALHEYSPTNGLGGPEFRTAISTPWAQKIHSEIEASRVRRTYSLAYTFGPAPRHMSISRPWTSPLSPQTTLIPATPSTSGIARIQSHITTRDGIHISYTLLSSPSAPPSGPLILCSNSILTTHHIWTSFTTALLSNPHFANHRILRYNSRGRSSTPGTQPVNLALLSHDIVALLDALRVPQAECLIGVSLGGATVLNTALKHSGRVKRFVACDTNASAPATNKDVWEERLALAKSEAATDAVTGEGIVGSKLAEETVQRWFANVRSDQTSAMEGVKEMVRTNSLEGFKRGVEALWEYDLREEMKRGEVEGLFVVGGCDGKLPEGMRGMVEIYGGEGGGKARLEVVKDAGHLPMVERPGEFVRVIGEFLGGVGDGLAR